MGALNWFFIRGGCLSSCKDDIAVFRCVGTLLVDTLFHGFASCLGEGLRRSIGNAKLDISVPCRERALVTLHFVYSEVEGCKKTYLASFASAEETWGIGYSHTPTCHLSLILDPTGAQISSA